MASVAESYPAAWADYRRRRNVVWGAFLGFLPGGPLIGVPLNRLFESETPVVVIALAAQMAIVVAVGRYGAWRCPKCGERFHLSRRLSNPLARRCLHCGLAKKDPRPHRP
jgi:predicted RNA-binding Zn-ribbon protein involved in translation (DUF1610 family)